MQFLTKPSLSFIDYPSRVSLVVYTMGCDFKCPGCHAKKVADSPGISEQEVLDFIKNYDNLNWVRGIVICGGEPTIHPDLPSFLRRLKKEAGLEIKLDTNGNNPEMLSRVIEEGIVDYIAMDIKGSKEIYSFVTGVMDIGLEKIEESISRVSKTPAYEFRTTLWPVNFGGDVGWMNEQEAKNMANWIFQVTGTRNHKHYLQRFVARTKDEMISPFLSKEELPKEMWKTPNRVVMNVKEAMKSQGYNCEIRG